MSSSGKYSFVLFFTYTNSNFSLDLLPVVAAGIGGALGSMYLDAKFLLSRDLHQMRSGAAGILR